MERLHRGDDAQGGEALDVLREQVLCVLGTASCIRERVGVDRVEGFDEVVVGLVADGVGDDLEVGVAGGVSVGNERAVGDAVGQQTAPVWAAGLIVEEGLAHIGGARAEAAVHVRLDAVDLEPVRNGTEASDREQGVVAGGRVEVESAGELAGVGEGFVDAQ